MEKKSKSELDELKKRYSILQEKYKLPGFDELNINFDIERAVEHETDYLLREIRRNLSEKIFLYLKFIEMILNPSSAPMFVFALVKNLSALDKKELEDIYKKLARLDLDIMELDLEYSEKKEAEVITKINKEWKIINKELMKTIKKFKETWDKSSVTNNKGYFG